MNREQANKILTPSSNSFKTIGEESKFLEKQERVTVQENCPFCKARGTSSEDCICKNGKISVVSFVNGEYKKRHSEIIDAIVYLDDLESKE